MRWLHVIAGIAWIGASLHFVWLDNSLTSSAESNLPEGVKGELWSIHGGGIYHFQKYQLAPPKWPSSLHWSKWEAYSTWITGTLLLLAVYYFKAQAYLVGPDKLISDPAVAILASIAFLFVGVGVYEAIVRSPLRNKSLLFAWVVGIYVAFSCWLSVFLFSDRAAFVHVGALMGTIMAANVFLGIIPSQKKFVAAVQAGQAPDEESALFAKQRSTHNNYFTLPVLFCMICIHYPFLYGHSFNWLILISIIAITAYARHFFNLRHRGILNYWILVRSVLAFLGLAAFVTYGNSVSLSENSPKPQAQQREAITDLAALSLIEKHCYVCHAKEPTYPGFYAPPGGIVLDDRQSVMASLSKSLSATQTNYMPLGNLTKMTDQERSDLVFWMQEKQAEQ